MTYYVLDVETANRHPYSICQIGIVEVNDFEITKTWLFMVNPDGPYEYHNVKVHGITEEDTQDAPTFAALYDELYEILSGHYCIQHTTFDQLAIDRSALRIGKKRIPMIWVDSAKIAQSTWDELKDCGFGLQALADHFGIVYKAHNALEDAKTTAKVVIQALKDSGKTLEVFHLEEMCAPKTIRLPQGKITLAPNKAGDYFGKNIVFTGYLKSSQKRTLTKASEMGFRVNNRVNFYTDLLVYGSPKSGKKSHKLEKAEKMKSEGSDIQLISEDDFLDEKFNLD